MKFEISSELKSLFPELNVLIGHIDGVTVEESGEEFQKFKEKLLQDVREKYTLETLKDALILRAYRDFFWKIGIDPTKIRPAAEALIRRVLADKSIPTINNVVDSYNLASIDTKISLAVFDKDKLKGKLKLRTAFKGEEFLGIAMKETMRLRGGEVVVSDDKSIIAIYPYRDADESKVNNRTKNLFFLVCGVPGIDKLKLSKSGKVTIDYITKFCGGKGELV
jgi:DNA/RNA-binding domain of Phe-tRNA-synthetase-like protein